MTVPVLTPDPRGQDAAPRGIRFPISLRLIRSQVETLVEKRYCGTQLEEKKIQKELAQIDRDLRALRTKRIRLEKRRAELLTSLGRTTSPAKSSAVRRTRGGLVGGKRER